MPDISMCENKGCSLKESCKRNKSIPKEYWQSYNDYKPDEKGNCNDYLEIRNNKE